MSPGEPPGGSMMRPVRPVKPVLNVIAVAVVWWMVAHNSGSGWVQLIGDAVVATLATGLIGPAAFLRRATISVAAAPSDGTAGFPVVLQVRSSSRVRLRPVDPPGPEGFAGPVRGRRRAGAGIDVLTVVPGRRGVHRAIVVDIATAAPFALLWWARRTILTLPAELVVAPRLGRPMRIPPQVDDGPGDGRPRSPSAVGEPRGVHRYQPGDSRRWMHWPATAHAGAFMVREMEAPAAEPVTVAVALPADVDDAERVAESAFGTVVALLDRGVPVVLATEEAAGPVVGPAADRSQAGRRLARAVAAGPAEGVTLRFGRPGTPPAGPGPPAEP